MLFPTEMMIYFWYMGTALKYTLCLYYYNKLDDGKVGKSSSSITKHITHNKADASPGRNETF